MIPGFWLVQPYPARALFGCLGPRGGEGGSEMKFGRVVENHKLINLVQHNRQMTSSLRHNDVITVKYWIFTKSCRSKLEKFRDVSDFKKRQINDTN